MYGCINFVNLSSHKMESREKRFITKETIAMLTISIFKLEQFLYLHTSAFN